MSLLNVYVKQRTKAYLVKTLKLKYDELRTPRTPNVYSDFIMTSDINE